MKNKVANETMGSFCSHVAKGTTKGASDLPPSDLGELLQEHEKDQAHYWFAKFTEHVKSLDERTRQNWRSSLLDFLVLARQIKIFHNKGGAEAEQRKKELILQVYDRHFSDETDSPLGVSDLDLRSRAVQGLKEYTGLHGAAGTRNVLRGNIVSGDSLVGLITEVYLDDNVYQKLENVYSKFTRQNLAPPKLAVLLSIL